jgi:hypothetical protein
MFLRMLQLLNSIFAFFVSDRMHVCPFATLSTNEQYVNEPVKEFESGVGQQIIAECHVHSFMDRLTDGQQILPYKRRIV